MRTGNFTLLFLAAAALEAAPIYNVTDLGPVGGGALSSVNNAGTAFGYTQTAMGRQAYSSAGALQAAGMESAAAQGNNFGQVAGTTWRDGRAEVTMWSNGMIGMLGLNGTTESYGNAINDLGWVAGGATDARGEMTAFLFREGTVHEIGKLGNGTWSSANGVNRGGQVTGTSEVEPGVFHAFTWTAGGGLTDLGTLGGASSYGAAINGKGTVAGNSVTRAGYTQAFSHDGNTMTGLGTLGGETSYAAGLNSAGDIVGASDVSPDRAEAFLYSNGVMTNLNRLLAADAGWRLLEAHSINDNGQIVGVGLNQGERRAFRLDPAANTTLDETLAKVQPQSLSLASLQAASLAEETPEPGTVTMLAAGLLFGGVGLLRRRG